LNHASLSKNDTVLEVGAGMGILSRELAQRCKQVFAVESDPRLIGILREQLTGVDNVHIIAASIFRASIPLFNKVVSIPPYQISSRLIEWLSERDFENCVLVLQKEFADHLVASVDSEEYSWLTVLTDLHFSVLLSELILRMMFYPSPNVDSIVVQLRPREPEQLTIRDERLFKQLLQSLFRQRNRKVRNAIIPFLKGILSLSKEKVTETANRVPYPNMRVRELRLEDFNVLFNAISQ